MARNLSRRLTVLETRLQALAPPALDPQEQETYDQAVAVLGPAAAARLRSELPRYWVHTGILLWYLETGCPATVLDEELQFLRRCRDAWQWHIHQTLREVETWLAYPAGQARFRDPQWYWHRKVTRAREFPQFSATISLAARLTSPDACVQWDHLPTDTRTQLWRAWVTAATAQRHAWEEGEGEDATAVLRAMDLTLWGLWGEFDRHVLHREWHYDQDHAYFSHQPNTLNRPENSREAWQALCARQLAERWVAEMANQAAAIDLEYWLERHGRDEADTREDPNVEPALCMGGHR